MAYSMRIGLACLLLTSALVSATSLEYYRSIFCDAQSPDFFLERYNAPRPLAEDKLCHQTPALTMAMKLVDGLASGCVVLAYEDYGCSNLVGSVPASGKCVAATKGKIGSWRASCNTTHSNSASAAVTSYASGELKRRSKTRVSAMRNETNMTNTTTNPVATASSIVSEFSSAISASASSTIGAEVTSSPYAGAALSSAVSSGADIGYNLTSYVTDTTVSTTVSGAIDEATTPGMATTTAPTITYTGSMHGNGTVTFQKGAAVVLQIGNGKMLMTVLTGMLTMLGAAVAL